jgi:hypothetical protein
MVYESPRRLADFAKGLIEGCAEHFETPMDIGMVPLTDDGSRVRFKMTPRAGP